MSNRTILTLVITCLLATLGAIVWMILNPQVYSNNVPSTSPSPSISSNTDMSPECMKIWLEQGEAAAEKCEANE